MISLCLMMTGLGLLLLVAPRPASGLSTGVVISQAFGGGGGSTGTYQNDYVELFNRGSSAVTLTGYSLQYGSSTGNFGSSTSNIYSLSTLTLQPGQYYLVRLGSAGTAGAALPVTPDQTTTNLSMSGSSGKVALANTTTALGCGATATPCTLPDARIVDSVAWGSSNNGEGGTTVNNSTAMASTQGAVRKANGCTETDNNRDDFDVVTAPVPRNSSSTSNPCSTGGATQLSINDVSLAEGNAGTTNFSFTVTLSQAAPSGGVTFDIATADGTATAGSDYVAQSLTGQTISAGNTTYSFTVTVNGDTITEFDENFSVNITNVTGAAIGDGQGSGTILNDDITPVAISAIQGSGATSGLVGNPVYTQGIVTGVRSSGFYIQTPDGSDDGNPLTSEGILVYVGSTPPAAAAVGNLVQVLGTVTEYVPSTDQLQPPLTELTSPTVTLVSSGNTLPAAIPLTTVFPNPSGAHDQLERVEGMLVSLPSLTVVAPTDGNVTETSATATSSGVFFGVVTGVARPFRESGIESPDPAPSGTIPPIPRFDANPERIRVDSDALTGTTALNVPTGAVITGLVGPLDYSYRTYTILPQPGLTITVTGGMTATAASLPKSTEFTVASYNLERFFDDVNDPAIGEPVLTTTAYNNRLGKASLAIRNFLRSPDILGVTEVENLTTLQALATRINTDATAAGQPNPQYTAHLVEGNDVGGIDVGFLVRTSPVTGTTPRVVVNSVVQENKTALFTNANSSTETLHDRPPLRLMATINHSNSASFAVTVIVNHLRSLNDVNNDSSAGSNGWSTAGARVRAKRQKQAEDLATIVQLRQTANPAERIILVGDFNAFEFNDGFVDSMGVITGAPAPDNETVVPGDGVDLLNPNLTNLSALVSAAGRYSYVYQGNAQTLDHVLINGALITNTSAQRVEHARINADFPETDRSNAATAVRLSDHDPVIAYFNVDAFCPTSLTVNTLADTADVNPGDGYCADSSGNCSLRAAIEEFNTFTLCPLQNIQIEAVGTINLTSALPSILKSVSITGPGADQLTIRRDSGGNYRIIHVSGNSLEVSISGVTLSNGNAGTEAGGGIFSTGTIILSGVVLSGNVAASGGGMAVVGASATIVSSTISGNQATAGAGGGIACQPIPEMFPASANARNVTLSAFLGIDKSTISGNSAISGGSGIDVSMSVSLMVLQGSTIASNTGGTAGIALSGDGLEANILNSILAGSTGTSGNLWRSSNLVTVTSLGSNLASDTAAGLLNGSSDLLSANPLLAPLGNYGGTTLTHALLPGSPAINAGPPVTAGGEDQRGTFRTGNSDIGAFESLGFILTQSAGDYQTAAPGTAFASNLAVNVIPVATNEPVNGGKITFTAPGSGASATVLGIPATITSGVATSGTVTANSVEGAYTVTANATGVFEPYPFSLTNNVLPSVVSIVRAGTNPTSASSVAFTVTFSESVTGVSPFNFSIAATPGVQMPGNGESALVFIPDAVISSVTGSGTTWTVNLTIGEFTGQLGLNMIHSDNVSDNLGGLVSNLPFAGQAYSIITAPKADLVLQKNGPPQVQQGGAIAYTLEISNIGPQNGDGASFIDTLPAGLTGVTASCNVGGGGALCPSGLTVTSALVSGTIPTLPAGGRVLITINATAPNSVTTLFNTATVTPPSGTTDPNITNNTGISTTSVTSSSPPSQANLSIATTGTRAVQINGRLRFRFRIVNSGPGAANGTTFTNNFSIPLSGLSVICRAYGGALCLQLPSIPMFQSTEAQSVITEMIPTLPVNGQIVFEIEGDAPSSAQAINTEATLTPPAGVTDPDAGSGTASFTANAQNDPPAQANLAVVKTGSTTVSPGGQVSYTIVVTNNGPSAANDATVTDNLSTLLTNAQVSCTGNGGAVCGTSSIDGSNQMTSTITTFPSGGTVTLTVTATAPASGTFANIATVTTPAGVNDPDISDNVSGSVNTTVLPCPTISVTPAALSDGTTAASYPVTFARTGGVGPTTWSLTGTLPTGLSFNQSTGVITGTPTATGNFTFTLRATDANGCFGERSYPVTITSQSFYEGDVRPLPNGNGTVDSSDWVTVGRFAVGLDTPQGGGEFQRADVAPRNQMGDGVVDVTDWVQAGRYAVGLDPLTNSGGPGSQVALNPTRNLLSRPALLHVVDARLVEGEVGTVEVELLSDGDINALGFTLRYDPRELALVDATSPASADARLLVNRLHEPEGGLAIAIALPTGAEFPAGRHHLLRLRFTPLAGHSMTSTTISIDGSLINLQAVSPAAKSLSSPHTRSTRILIKGRPATL